MSFGLGAPSQAQPGTSLFGGASTAPSGGLFGSMNTSTQQKPGLFGSLGTSQQQPQQQPQQQSVQGQNPAQNSGPVLQLGQSQPAPSFSQSQPSLWEEGRGLGVYRTIPAQIMLIKEKWDPNSTTSPLRTYLYQVVDEQNALFYQPGPGEDEHKWEEAVSNRPGPGFVPALARGFWDLGKRAQRQREFIEKINIRLHDINSSLDAQLEIHSQKVAPRLQECRRKHVVASQRTLALAAKIQILRNRGYVMDNAEEELKDRLAKLEREVFDPVLNAREQEIWARMLGIRERSRNLRRDLEQSTQDPSAQAPPLDEDTLKAAKKALEAYDVQLRHLGKEMRLIQEEYGNWWKITMPNEPRLK